MKIRPLGDRVLIKRKEDSEEKTVGGIIIPDTAKEKQMKGTVIAVGNGKLNADGTRTALEIKEGDEVLFEKYHGTEVKDEGEEYLIIKEDGILAIIG